MTTADNGSGTPRGRMEGSPRNKAKHATTSLACDDEEQARLDRLRKRLKMPMNKVVHLSLAWMEQLLDAQAAGRKVKMEDASGADQVLMILLPADPRAG